MKIKFLTNVIYRWYSNLIRQSKYRWWVIAGSLIYLIGPVDILPDVFPIIGWIDDGLVATLLVTELSQFLGDRLKGRKQSSQEQENLNQTNSLSIAK